MSSQTETIVMSVGGSLIVPDQIDTAFLQSLKEFITTEVTENNRQFIIIAGGGRTARNYQDAMRSIGDLTSEDLDWIGIHATRLNGHLLRTVLKDLAHRVMITNPDDILDAPKDAAVIIASGYRPGASTDLRAVQIAQLVGANKVINFSNISHVYTADPKKDPAAEKLEDVTWSDFRKLIPEKWDPGLSSPFDPEAAKAAEIHNIEVATISGENFTELPKYLAGESFVGTRIHS